jgi:hypothetical protein
MGRRSFRYTFVNNTRLGFNPYWHSFSSYSSDELGRGISRKYPDLYLESLSRYAGGLVDIDIVAWQRSYSYVRRSLRENVGYSTGFTFEEAVERILQNTRGSSAGFEWNKYGQTKGEVLTNPEALDKIRSRLNCLDELEYRALFTLSLKDELRDEVDGLPKKARLFFPCELSFLIATVMVYGRWNDKFNSTFFEGCMGGTFLRGGADRLVEYLSVHDRFGEGDAHKFDSKQRQLLRQLVYGLRNELLETCELSATVTRILLSPRVHSPQGYIFQLFGCNPSGGYNTKIDNSILSMFVLRYCFYRACPTASDDEIRSMVEGDDFVYSTCTNFSPDMFQKYSSELGLAYDGGRLTDLGTVSFCQHRFEKRGLYYISIPDRKRALATMAVNRCNSLFDLCLMSQSVIIEHFYNEDVRRLIRRFQEWAVGQGVDMIEYMTDSAIERLHTLDFVYETRV